jgi:hypothetical protein
MTNPMTTTGDTIYSSSGSTPARLGIGTAGQVLQVNSGATAPEWATTADQTPLTTKGDLFGFDTADARIPIGTNGHVLTADSAQTLGLKWAAPAGGGKVLQVVGATTSTETTIASTSYTDTTITATITPTSATSKIMVMVMGKAYAERLTSNQNIGVKLLRDATALYTSDYFQNINGTGLTGISFYATLPVLYLDSPATTSAITYKIQGRVGFTSNSGSSIWQISGQGASTITLFEIGA